MHSRQQLAIFLSKLKVFDRPNINLEQYPTDSEVAATILWDASMQGEIEGKRVADFGCGTGILGIGALALGAKHVTFIELDQTVFPLLMENIHSLEEQQGEHFSYDIIHGNIEQYKEPVDLVLQNPPFGTQQKHADLLFLRQAISLAPIVYTLHKTSTKEYLKGIIQQQGARVIHEFDFSFPLKQTMSQHSKRIQRIDVTCLKLQQ